MDREIFFPPNKTECIPRNSNEISALFIGALNCRRRGEKKDRRTAGNPGKFAREIRGPPLVHTSLLSAPIRDDCPFIFNEDCLIQTVARHARLNPFCRKKADNNRPFSPPLPALPSTRSADQAECSRRHERMIEEHRSSEGRTNRAKNRTSRDFRKLTDASEFEREFFGQISGSKRSAGEFNFGIIISVLSGIFQRFQQLLKFNFTSTFIRRNNPLAFSALGTSRHSLFIRNRSHFSHELDPHRGGTDFLSGEGRGREIRNKRNGIVGDCRG